MRKLLLASRKICTFFPGTILFPERNGDKNMSLKKKYLDSLLCLFISYLLSIYSGPDPDLGTEIPP